MTFSHFVNLKWEIDGVLKKKRSGWQERIEANQSLTIFQTDSSLKKKPKPYKTIGVAVLKLTANTFINNYIWHLKNTKE